MQPVSSQRARRVPFGAHQYYPSHGYKAPLLRAKSNPLSSSKYATSPALSPLTSNRQVLGYLDPDRW